MNKRKEIKIQKIDLKHHFFEFLRYSTIGTSSTILQIFLLYVFTEFFPIYYVISGVLAYILAGFYNFYFNKTWTFREHIHHKIVSKYIKFLGLNIVAFLSNIFLLYVFTEYFSIHYLISQFIAILIISVLNFSVNKFVIFKKDYDPV